MKIILVDDEAASTDVLRIQLEEYCKDAEVVAECHSAKDAINQIQKLSPDLVFLDIEMPDMNGFELLKHLHPIRFEVIFVTAYDQFALQAFRENAIDYLLKPVSKSDLIEAYQKAKEKKTPVQQRIDSLLLMFREQLDRQKKIALPTHDGISFIGVNEIVRCESDSNYTYIFLSSGEKVIITKTLKQIEEALSAYPFYRVHQSHLVNLNHIKRFSKDGGGYLLMSDNTTITVARQRKEGLMELFSKL